MLLNEFLKEHRKVEGSERAEIIALKVSDKFGHGNCVILRENNKAVILPLRR